MVSVSAHLLQNHEMSLTSPPVVGTYHCRSRARRSRLSAATRHRPVLQRIHGGPHRDPIAVHRLLPQELRGVQQRVEKREARSDCVGNRVCMDLGGDTGQYTLPGLAICGAQFTRCALDLAAI